MSIISIEGNIGSGKTTLLRAIEATETSIVVAYEPVDAWMRPDGADGADGADGNGGAGGKSILELFYEDKAKYAFPFQMYVLMTRVQLLMNMVKRYPDRVIVCERSHIGDAEIFAKGLLASGLLSQLEWTVYQQWNTFARSLLDPHLKGIVYMQASPEVCETRIACRARQGEDKIDLAYLALMHQQHEAWLPPLVAGGTTSTIPCCTILDASKSVDKLLKDALAFVRRCST